MRRFTISSADRKSVGVERSYPKQLNHYFVKDTTLA